MKIYIKEIHHQTSAIWIEIDSFMIEVLKWWIIAGSTIDRYSFICWILLSLIVKLLKIRCQWFFGRFFFRWKIVNFKKVLKELDLYRVWIGFQGNPDIPFAIGNWKVDKKYLGCRQISPFWTLLVKNQQAKIQNIQTCITHLHLFLSILPIWSSNYISASYENTFNLHNMMGSLTLFFYNQR